MERFFLITFGEPFLFPMRGIIGRICWDDSKMCKLEDVLLLVIIHEATECPSKKEKHVMYIDKFSTRGARRIATPPLMTGRHSKLQRPFNLSFSALLSLSLIFMSST